MTRCDRVKPTPFRIQDARQGPDGIQASVEGSGSGVNGDSGRGGSTARAGDTVESRQRQKVAEMNEIQKKEIRKR